MKRSTPLKRSSFGTKKRKPLRRRSAKTERIYAGDEKNEGRRALVARLLKAKPRCEADILGVCVGIACDVHEVLARSAGGSILDEDNLKCICRPCHSWIGDHPKAALAMGLHRSRYAGRNP